MDSPLDVKEKNNIKALLSFMRQWFLTSWTFLDLWRALNRDLGAASLRINQFTRLLAPCCIIQSTHLAQDLIPQVRKLYRARCYVFSASNKMFIGQSQKKWCVLAYFVFKIFITMKTQPRNLYQNGSKITMHFSQHVVREDKYF